MSLLARLARVRARVRGRGRGWVRVRVSLLACLLFDAGRLLLLPLPPLADVLLVR